jgi:phosphate transport system permease protein
LWGSFVLAPFLGRTVEPWLAENLGFLPFFQGPPIGVGMLAAGVILGIMIIPTVTSVSREVMEAVPAEQRQALAAVGATPWDVVQVAVLPYARSGIIGAFTLGLGRAVGETMAVTMVIGNRPEISLSLFAPAHTLTSVIVNEFTEAAAPMYLAALFHVALFLFGVTLLFNILARLLIYMVGWRGRNNGSC